MANMLILAGIVILMTPMGFYKFIAQRGRGQGTIAFFLGIILVLCKLPLPGIICEATGAYWLFGGFWPMLLSLVTKLPKIGKALLPFISKLKGDDLPL